MCLLLSGLRFVRPFLIRCSGVKAAFTGLALAYQGRARQQLPIVEVLTLPALLVCLVL